MQRLTRFLLVLIVLLFALASPAAAQEPPTEPSPWYSGTLEEFGQTLENTENVHKEGYDVKTQVDLENALSCQIMGCSKNPEHTFYYGKSAIAGINNFIAMMYANPPADLALWINDTAIALGFKPKPAYAQGIGFSGLAALLPIWKAFRNIAYLLLAIVMIVIGFMVMFRKKIDPKTVVTVQNALPRIVITTLLITFSYAIVGIMIDLMYLAIMLGASVLGSANLTGVDVAKLQSTYVNGGFWALAIAVFDPLTKMNPFAQIPEDLMTGQWLEALKDLGTGILVNSTLVGPLMQTILSLVFLFAFIRIFFMLLSAYIQIILAVLFGPLQILLDAIPGGNGFSSWIKNLLANISVFPITVLLLIIGNVLRQNFESGGLWEAPLIPHGVGTNTFAITLIWLGIILAIPQLANMIKEALKAKPPIAAGPGALLGPAVGGIMGIINLFYQGAMIGSFFRGHKPPPDTKETSRGSLSSTEIEAVREMLKRQGRE